ncbi:MAG: SulP family inorganic anion transporter [Methylothermaceae bacterium]|nr:SulP family inorganic anion transporter [Methylothermaceae bacterium]
MNATTASFQFPRAGLAGLKDNWRADLLAGFQIFLIALPLCLGIAMASKFPPMAGIIAAMVGGLLISRINGSYVTISGPAAGLIVVTLGAVDTLGGGDPVAAYHRTLAVIVCAGMLQAVICFLRVGRLMALVPASVVEGMLAAIGVIIMAKQFYVMIGVKPEGELLESIAAIPGSLLKMNPEIAVIGLSGLALLILWEIMRSRVKLMEWIPAPIVVVSLGLVMGLLFDLDHHHKYSWHSTFYEVGPESLLPVPQSFWDGFAFPDFSMIGTGAFWIAVISVCLVSTLETLLSAAAIDKLDPYQRQSDLNKDGAALGIGSSISGAIGGLPMISEIVRSSANIRFGARTGWANFFHAAFLLVFVALFPSLIHEIPKAALGALLVFTGYKLASPRQFLSVWEIGKEQLFLFVFTIFAVLATDLLIGVGLGIVAKIVLHILRGVNFKQLLKIAYHIDQPDPHTFHVRIDGAAIFSNFLALKSALTDLPRQKNLVFDLSRTEFIDHTVMDFIHEFCRDYEKHGCTCIINGLESHKTASDHPLAARRRRSLNHLGALFLSSVLNKTTKSNSGSRDRR